MGIEDVIQGFKETVEDIKRQTPKMLIETAGDSFAFIQKRVVDSGKVANGSKSNYKGGYYKELRKDKGRQVSHKDYSFTGEMWNNISVIPTTLKENGSNYFTVDIDALSKENRDKLKWNNERDNVKILENTDKEKEQLQVFFESKIKRIIKKNLG